MRRGFSEVKATHVGHRLARMVVVGVVSPNPVFESIAIEQHQRAPKQVPIAFQCVALNQFELHQNKVL